MKYNNDLTLRTLMILTANPEWERNEDLKELVEGIGHYAWKNTEEKNVRRPKTGEMYYLQWTKSNDSHTDNLGIYRSIKDAEQAIFDWWKLNDYKPSYVRSWTINDVTTIDYGFHTYFYKITKITKDNFGDVVMKGLKK